MWKTALLHAVGRVNFDITLGAFEPRVGNSPKLQLDDSILQKG